MDKIFRYLFILINLHQIFEFVRADQENLQQKFTSKCDDLCIDQGENGTKVNFAKAHNFANVDISLIFHKTTFFFSSFLIYIFRNWVKSNVYVVASTLI